MNSIYLSTFNLWMSSNVSDGEDINPKKPHNRALSLETSLKPRQEQTQKPYFVTRYSKEAVQNKHIIKKNWDIIECDSSLSKGIQNPRGSVSEGPQQLRTN